jgi:hypothetical protein
MPDGSARVDIEAMIVDLITMVKVAEQIGSDFGGRKGLLTKIYDMWSEVEATVTVPEHLKQ